MRVRVAWIPDHIWESLLDSQIGKDLGTTQEISPIQSQCSDGQQNVAEISDCFYPKVSLAFSSVSTTTSGEGANGPLSGFTISNSVTFDNANISYCSITDSKSQHWFQIFVSGTGTGNSSIQRYMYTAGFGLHIRFSKRTWMQCEVWSWYNASGSPSGK